MALVYNKFFVKKGGKHNMQINGLEMRVGVYLLTTRKRKKILKIHINKRLITEKVKGHLKVDERLLNSRTGLRFI